MCPACISAAAFAAAVVKLADAAMPRRARKARAAYQAALAVVAPEPERRLLERRLRELPLEG
jgi:hypothetical protein